MTVTIEAPIRTEKTLSSFLTNRKRPSTAELNKQYIKKFFQTINPFLSKKPTIEALDRESINYLSTPRDIKADLENYRNAYRGVDSPNTLNARIYSVISYLNYYEVPLPQKLGKQLLDKAETITEDHIPTTQELKRILDALPMNAKTLALVLAQSGLRIGEALRLKVNDIEFAEDGVSRIIVRTGNYATGQTKTGKKRFSYISPEATELVQQWLVYRPQYIVQAQSRARMLYKSKIDVETRLFPFSETQYYQTWAEGLKKAGLNQKDESIAYARYLIHAHSLRKYFKTRGNWQNIEICEYMMGHSLGVAGIYARYDQDVEKVKAEYIRAMPGLLVYSNGKALSNLRDEIANQKEDTDKLLREYQFKSMRLENQVAGLQTSEGNYLKAFQQEQAEWINAVKSLMTEVSELRAKIQHAEEMPAAEDMPVLVPKNFNLSDYEARQKRLGELLADQAVRA